MPGSWTVHGRPFQSGFESLVPADPAPLMGWLAMMRDLGHHYQAALPVLLTRLQHICEPVSPSRR